MREEGGEGSGSRDVVEEGGDGAEGVREGRVPYVGEEAFPWVVAVL